MANVSSSAAGDLAPVSSSAAGDLAPVLSRTDEALTPEEITSLLRKRLGDDQVVDTVVEYRTFTVVLTNAGYRAAAELCRDDQLLAFDMFDTTVGIDEREDGFSVVTVLYSTTKGVRICLKTFAEGGREAPVVPSLADLYPGANWSERETWDMFGIEFDGHPGLAPRILTVENFEGWPLRKDFYLATREAKPWPGIKEPAELDEAGNVVERIPGPGDAPGPMALDKAMADQAKLANPSLVDPEEPVTEPAPTDDAEQAEVASDSGAVVQSEKQRAEESGEQAADVAKQRAEEQRVAAAEARARKAAERADAEHVSTPEEDVPEVPKGTAASPEAGTQGGPPAEAPADDSGTVDVDGTEPGISTTEGGISETVERAREEGSVDYVGDDGPEAPVEPEGRDSSAAGADEDAADAVRPDDPPPADGDADREDGA